MLTIGFKFTVFSPSGSLVRALAAAVGNKI
jgi:hypothetical protein